MVGGPRARARARLGRCSAHLAPAGASASEPTPWAINLLAQIERAGPLAQGRRFDLNGENRGHRLPQSDDVVPLQVDKDMRVLPSELQRVRDAADTAEASGDALRAAMLRDLLFTVEPKPELSMADCAPSTLEACSEFFQREGFVCVPRVLEGERLQALQEAFHRVQAPVWSFWEAEARKSAGNFGGEDFVAEERFQGFGHGRLYFDVPHDSFWSEAAFVDLIAPPRLERVVRALGGDGMRFGGVQPRTVPGPENDGGYCSWHRDCGGPLRNDALWKTMDPPLDPPRTPILKCFIYLNDVAYDQGPTAVLRGSHLLPWAPDGLYDLHQGFAGAPGHGLFNEEAGYCPTASLVNKMVFAAKAGDACIFDIATFHTSMPNTSSLPREAIITTCSDAGGFGESQRDLVDGWDSAGLLNDAPTRRMLGRA